MRLRQYYISVMVCLYTFSIVIDFIHLFHTEKTLCELMEPIEMRMKAVQEFVQDVKPNLEYRVLPIYDGFGPTVTDKTMDLIVLSQETQKGGEMINTERKKKVTGRLEGCITPNTKFWTCVSLQTFLSHSVDM